MDGHARGEGEVGGREGAGDVVGVGVGDAGRVVVAGLETDLLVLGQQGRELGRLEEKIEKFEGNMGEI